MKDLADDRRIIVAARIARAFRIDPLIVLRSTEEEWALRACCAIAAGRDERKTRPQPH